MEMKTAVMKAVTVCMEIWQKVAKGPFRHREGAGFMLLHFSPLNSSRSPSTGENTATLARGRKEIWSFGIPSLLPSCRVSCLRVHTSASPVSSPLQIPLNMRGYKEGHLLVRISRAFLGISFLFEGALVLSSATKLLSDW